MQPESFHPGNVESLLNSGAHNYINHPRGLRFENEDDLVLSKIYDWYADDFGDNEKELLQHLMRYANQSTKNDSNPSMVTSTMNMIGISMVCPDRVADLHLRTTKPE